MINNFKVDQEHVNMRLDKFVRKYSKEESLALIFSLIRKGNIKVNGKKSKENYRLLINDEIYFPDNAKIEMGNIKINNNINISKFKDMIVFEDDDIFIINKPNNIPMHKGNNHEYGISEMAKKYYNNSNVNFANRLDLETAGLVIGTKNLNILRKINQVIKDREILKKYIAMINSNNLKLNEKFIVEKPIEITETGVKISENGLYSKTIFKVINIEKDKALLDVDLKTGRKHQIRVHLSSINKPIIGDNKYGGITSNRMYLKCYRIKFLNYDIEIDKVF